jgi:hypothetical protein
MPNVVEIAAPPTKTSQLPGARVLRRARRLMVIGVVTALAYTVLLLGSKGAAAGGVDGSGGFVDADGNPTTHTPTVVNATLHASPVMYFVFAAIVFFAIGRVLRRASDEAAAVRALDRAMLVLVGVAIVSLIAAYVWFFALPPSYWVHDGVVIQPFPFATVHATTGS